MSITKHTRKLTLNQETILRLDAEELDHVHGGKGVRPTFGCTPQRTLWCTTRHLRTHLGCVGGM
jgi:hypothetical protein